MNGTGNLLRAAAAAAAAADFKTWFFVCLFVFGAVFTAEHLRPHLDEFTTMAESYQAAKADTPDILNGLDIYFFVADFSVNQQSFQQVL